MQEQTRTSEQTAILVVGMHRGGTSALAGLLHLLGFEGGNSLMPAVEGVNSKGFWEHLDVFRIHERLFAAFGRSIFDPREMPAGWREHPEFRIAVNDVRALIERDFATVSRWIVKDPRLCKFAPVWFEAFDALGIRPRVLMIARHPIEIARSSRALGWCDSTARAHLCWLQYMFEAERTTRQTLRACVNYADLINDWRLEITRIGKDLSIEWPLIEDERAAEIDRFLDVRERHHVEPSGAHSDAGNSLPSLVVALHGVFSECVRSQELWEKVAALGDIYRYGEGVFGPCLDQDIIDLTLTRLAMEQQRANIVRSEQTDAVTLRYRLADESYRDEALVAQHCDLSQGRVAVQWTLPAGVRPEFMRMNLGARPGAFVLRAIRLDGIAIESLASHVVAGSAIHAIERDDKNALRVASARESAWLELDLRGLLTQIETTTIGVVELELERESGAAELASLITCAVGEALDARLSGNPAH